MISIAPLPRENVAEVAHLQLPPAQRGFVGPIEEMTADDDPLHDFYAIRHGTETVGFFKVDRGFERTDPRLRPGSHALRGLLIGGQYQRHGYGSEALQALPRAMQCAYPHLTELYLRVDASNTPAIRAYRARGWQDAPLPPVTGTTGSENTMILNLRGPNA